MSDLDWFFRSPRSVPHSDEAHSSLYLLRRDIDTCFGTDPNTGISWQPIDKRTGASIYCRAIWPGTMAILAGIDMLGKFLAGTDKTRGIGSVSVRDRFKVFATLYLGLNGSDAGLIYQLRNSLLHTFGLYSEEQDKNGNIQATYNFSLSVGLTTMVKHLKDDYYQVDVQRLRELFEQAVIKYHVDLSDACHKDHENLKKKFDSMLPKHAKAITFADITLTIRQMDNSPVRLQQTMRDVVD